MKNRTKTMVGLLAGYILCLPLALLFHAHTHEHDSGLMVNGDMESIIIESDADCALCDFYFDQQLFVENVGIVAQEGIVHSDYHDFAKLFFTVRVEQLHLRGPPMA